MLRCSRYRASPILGGGGAGRFFHNSVPPSQGTALGKPPEHKRNVAPVQCPRDFPQAALDRDATAAASGLKALAFAPPEDFGIWAAPSDLTTYKWSARSAPPAPPRLGEP